MLRAAEAMRERLLTDGGRDPDLLFDLAREALRRGAPSEQREALAAVLALAQVALRTFERAGR